MGPLAMLLLLIAALALFTATMIRRLDVLRAAQPDNRLDRIGQRLRRSCASGSASASCCTSAGPAGCTPIFAGFLVVAFRTLTLIIRGFDADWRVPV
jgi:hypothetical protein